jgi:hypothetical protein
MRFILILLFLFASVFPGDKFNDTKISLIVQDTYPNAKIYSDSLGHQYIECRLAVIPGGYVSENGTPLEGKYLVDLSGLDRETLEYIISLRNYERAEKQFKNRK